MFWASQFRAERFGAGKTAEHAFERVEWIGESGRRRWHHGRWRIVGGGVDIGGNDETFFDRIKTQAHLTFCHIRIIVYQANLRFRVVMLLRAVRLWSDNLDLTTSRLDMARSLFLRVVETFYFRQFARPAR